LGSIKYDIKSVCMSVCLGRSCAGVIYLIILIIMEKLNFELLTLNETAQILGIQLEISRKKCDIQHLKL